MPNKTFGTVVAPTGACPSLTLYTPNALVSNPQYPCSLFALTTFVWSFILYDFIYVLNPTNDAKVPVRE